MRPRSAMEAGAQVNAREEIEAVVAFEGRSAGTDAERRAGDHLARRLRALGRTAEVEPVVVRPRFALTHALHAVVAVVGSVASVSSPPVGAALVLLAAVSTYGDLTGRFFLFRRLTAVRASQNVVSTEGGEKPGVLVLLAHYDAAHTAGVFRPRSVERRARIGARIHRPFGLAEVFFLALIVLLGCCLVRLVVNESVVLGLVQLVPTAALIASVPLLLDIVFGQVVPGANDNASGVATAMALADRYGGRLEHFDVWCVLTGAEEAQALGMRAWLKRHDDELDPARTLFVELDKVGAGTVHYARRQGLVFPLSFDDRLLELCDEIAREGAAARGYVARAKGDAAATRGRGFRAISISCLNALGYAPLLHAPGDTPERLDDAALENTYSFCATLVERVDAELGPELEGAPSASSGSRARRFGKRLPWTRKGRESAKRGAAP